MSTAQPVEGTVLDNPPSPKVIGAGVASLLVTVALALLMYLNTEQGVQLYAALPVLLIVAIKSLVTGAATWIVSYQLTDPQRILDLATSPKVIAATAVSILATAVVEVLNFLLTPEGQSLYSNWPPLAVVALSAGIPAVAAAVAGYIVKDPARVTPSNPTPTAKEPVELVGPDNKTSYGLAGDRTKTIGAKRRGSNFRLIIGIIFGGGLLATLTAAAAFAANGL